MQCVAVCSGVLQCDAVCCGVSSPTKNRETRCSMLQCIAVCCSVLQCVAVSYWSTNHAKKRGGECFDCGLIVCRLCFTNSTISLENFTQKQTQTETQVQTKGIHISISTYMYIYIFTYALAVWPCVESIHCIYLFAYASQCVALCCSICLYIYVCFRFLTGKTRSIIHVLISLSLHFSVIHFEIHAIENIRSAYDAHRCSHVYVLHTYQIRTCTCGYISIYTCTDLHLCMSTVALSHEPAVRPPPLLPPPLPPSPLPILHSFDLILFAIFPDKNHSVR